MFPTVFPLILTRWIKTQPKHYIHVIYKHTFVFATKPLEKMFLKLSVLFKIFFVLDLESIED
jgi:hypothetical protein